VSGDLVTVNCRVSMELAEQISEEATKAGISRHRWVRQALLGALETTPDPDAMISAYLGPAQVRILEQASALLDIPHSKILGEGLFLLAHALNLLPRPDSWKPEA